MPFFWAYFIFSIMNSAVASSLIGAGGSIFNGIAGLIATNKANKTNREIAAETNASNERINASQLQYNWDMWHATNEYNNPSAQRQRLVDAGLNPIYYGLDGNSTTVGNSYNPIASQQASPTIPNDYSAFGDSILRAAQLRNIEADTDLKKSNSDFHTEQSETIRQLRSGQLVIQGQQIELNEDTHNLNGAKLKEISASIDAIHQNMKESDARIADYQSQVSKREFDLQLAKCYYEVEKRYKEGLLDLQERRLVLDWFNAYTDRQNADTNYFNAETSRSRLYQDALDQNSTRPYRIGLMRSVSSYNKYNSYYMRDENLRRNKAFTFEQINRSANAYQSIIEAHFAPSRETSNLFKGFF